MGKLFAFIARAREAAKYRREHCATCGVAIAPGDKGPTCDSTECYKDYQAKFAF